jgi:hypothetical protein
MTSLLSCPGPRTIVLALGLAALPSLAAAQTLVVVRNEAGVGVSGAEVYQNCVFRGTTHGGGLLILPSAVAGDQIDVRKLVATGPTGKGSHDGWSYHAYHTNILMTNDGGQSSTTIGDPAAAQTIVVRPSNTQIGLNMVASVEYNADPANLNDIALGLQRASEYLFDVTDGQMFYEQATIFEDSERFADADIQFFGTQWPMAHVVGPTGVANPAYHMYMPGPGFDGNRYTPGTWQTPNGFRTIIHENGHYGFGAYDEYNRSGGRPATCTESRYSDPETHRASVMAYNYDATEICSDMNHSVNTSHHEATGRSVWGTVVNNWTGPWSLRTPMTRGATNPGPTSLSCFARMTPRIVPVAASSCSPLRLRATSGGMPITRTPVVLRHGSRTIAQGDTDDLGELLIHGAAAGDVVSLRPRSRGGRDQCFWDAGAVVDQACGPLVIDATWRCHPQVWDRPFPIIRWIHEGDPPLIDVRIPADDAGLPLQFLVAQDGGAFVPVPLSYDQGSAAFVGSLPFDGKGAPQFTLQFKGIDDKGKPFETSGRLQGARFRTAGATPDATSWELFPADGDVNLEVNRQSLPDGAGVASSQTMFPLDPPQGLVVVAASVTVEGEVAMAQPLILSLRYDPSAAKKGTERLYRLDGEGWKAVTAELHPEIGRVSAQIDRWGTFAVFGERP